MVKVCTSKKKLQRRQDQSRRRQTDGKQNPSDKQKMHFVQGSNEDEVYSMYHLSSKHKKSLKVQIELAAGWKQRWKSTLAR